MIGMKKKRSIPVKLDKLTVLKILGIAGAAIFFYWALQNLSLLADAAGWLLNILWPLLLGFCMAFVLNIPMRFFERHLLKNPKNKRAAALRRPLCILLSLLAIIVILTAVFALVVPELLSAFAVLGEAIPEFLTARAEVGAGRGRPVPAGGAMAGFAADRLE